MKAALQPHDQAFPSAEVDGRWNPGITVREYFAALAMQGILSAKAVQLSDYGPTEYDQKIASNAIMCADALIAALGKESTK